MSNVTVTYGAYSALNVTALQSLASSATVGWQSDRIDNTSTQALNYEIDLELTTANTAPANDKCIYVFICPWVYNGSGFRAAGDLGTVTAPGTSDSSVTIASPPNLKLLGAIQYTTQNATVRGHFQVCPGASADMPDAFTIIVINFSGAALSTSCIVSVRPIAAAVT
jgi:hypothetical protein